MGTGELGTQGEGWIPRGANVAEANHTRDHPAGSPYCCEEGGRKGGNGEEIEEKRRARSARVSLRKKKLKLKL